MTTEIVAVRARQIYDSRAYPTVEVDVRLAGGAEGRAAVPAGASTGRVEALERRDGGAAFGGKGVKQALQSVHEVIAPAVVGRDAARQEELDRLLVELDGTENKARLGANAVLGVSLAAARAAAAAQGVPLYRYLGGAFADTLPVPFLNVLNGGKHADNNVDVQEFLIVPHGFARFSEALAAAVEVYLALRGILRARRLPTAVGDEGGFAPDLAREEEALDLLLAAIEAAGLRPGEDVALALDFAASELYADGNYRLGGRVLGKDAYRETIGRWVADYPIVSLEDPAAEDDLELWRALTQEFGQRVQIVGDDVFVTNARRLAKGAEDGVANAVLVKPNQIGTLSETVATVRLAGELGYRTMISHRSGETEDTFLADLAVAFGGGQVKTGAPARSERVAKYNRLLRIEEELGGGRFPGRLARPRPR